MVFQIKAMDKEQEEFQFLGFHSIFKQSLKVLLTWPKIFLQITLAFIFPHSCLFLANNWISMFLSSKIHHDLTTLPNNQVGSPNYTTLPNTVSSEVTTFWLIKVVYIIISIVLSLFAISAVVYTVACIYSGKGVTFKKVLSVVPKVWKRLMITLLCNFCVLFAYFFAVSLVMVTLIWIVMITLKQKNSQVGILFLGLIIIVLFLLGFFYMAIIWQLANVISIMEKDCGFKALKKSKKLVKGKMGTAFGIFVVIGLCGYILIEVMKNFASFGLLGKITFGIPSVMLWALLNIFSLVVHTIFYLVCKSYHHESIDKSLLADHLDVYLSEYVPLKAEVQLEQL